MHAMDAPDPQRARAALGIVLEWLDGAWWEVRGWLTEARELARYADWPATYYRRTYYREGRYTQWGEGYYNQAQWWARKYETRMIYHDWMVLWGAEARIEWCAVKAVVG